MCLQTRASVRWGSTHKKMDILTPKGIRTRKQETRAVEIWQRFYPRLVYAETPKHLPAKVDALLVEGPFLRAVVETKCREMTLEQLRGQYDDEWLITASKVWKAQELARSLCLPLVGFLYLVKSDSLLVVQITDESGDLIIENRLAWTTTQKTVNGGQARRQNLFLKMSSATQLDGSG